MKLISLLPLNIREAEKEEEKDDASAEGGEKNPFAGSEEGGEEDAGGGDETADTADTDSEEGGEAKTSDEAKPLDVVFNPVKVRKYNDKKIKDNKGTVVNISRFGLTVKLSDESTVFVNFDDIL